MRIIDLVGRLEALEHRAGHQGWGGEYREELFDTMLHYFKLHRGRTSAGGLLAFMIEQSEKWFSGRDENAWH